MSRTFGDDPAVGDILATYQVRERELELKGFDRPVPICQIRPQREYEQNH